MKNETVIGITLGFLFTRALVGRKAGIGAAGQHKIRFVNEMINSYGGQADMVLLVYVNSDVAGTLNYSEYDGNASVQMLEVSKDYRRQGIGTELLKKLQKLYPGKEIDLGYASAEGAALLKTVKREFYPNKKYDLLLEKLNNFKAERQRILRDINTKNDYKESNKLNSLSDKIYETEDKLSELQPGKWLIIT